MSTQQDNYDPRHVWQWVRIYYLNSEPLQQTPTKQCFAEYTSKQFLINEENVNLLRQKQTIEYNQGKKEILAAGDVRPK